MVITEARKLKILKNSYVGRRNSFMFREKGGRWYQRKEELSDEILLDYIRGKYDIALYPQYQNLTKKDKSRDKYRCRWIGVDIDLHNKLFTDENWKKLGELLYIACSHPEEYFFCEKKYLIAEQSAHGWHIFIILKKDTFQDIAYEYGRLIRNKLMTLFSEWGVIKEIEVYPKSIVSEGGVGNGLKPLFNRSSNLTKLPRIYELDISPKIKEIFKKMKDADKYVKYTKPKITSAKTPKLYPKRRVLSGLKTYMDDPETRKCIKNCIEGVYQLDGSIGNSMRVKVALELRDYGYGREGIIDAFINQKDFAREEKDVREKGKHSSGYYVERILKKTHYTSPSCRSIQGAGYCDALHCKFMNPCSLKVKPVKKLKQSVVGWNQLHEKIATVIKNKGRYFLRKTTRSGTTTATIMQSIRLKKKMLMIAPTIRIYKETLKDAVELATKHIFEEPQTYRLQNNIDTCKRLRNSIDKDLKGIDISEIFPFLLKGVCDGCKYSGGLERVMKEGKHDWYIRKNYEYIYHERPTCEFQRFLKEIDNHNIVYVSTEKFKILINMAKFSERASYLLNRLLDWCDFIFIDECYHLLTVNFKEYVMVKYDKIGNRTDKILSAISKVLDLQNKYTDDNDIEFLTNLEKFLRWLEKKIREDYETIDKSRFETIPKEFFDDAMTSKQWVLWYNRFYNHFKKNKDYEIRNLIEVFLALSSNMTYIQQIVKRNGERLIKLCSISDVKHFINFINKLNKPFIMTDAVRPPIDLNKLFGNINDVIINDPRGTAKKQTVIICQQSDPFWNNKPKEDRLREFLAKYGMGKELFLVHQSKDYKKRVDYILTHNDLRELDVGESTWHGSDGCMGVKSRLRRMLNIGSSFAPRHVYDYVAEIYKNLGYFDEKVSVDEISTVLENHQARASFFQSISRVKDPEGEQISEVFTVGMKYKVVKRWFDGMGVATPKVITEAEYKKLKKRK